jgi:hypothetical protein
VIVEEENTEARRQQTAEKNTEKAQGTEIKGKGSWLLVSGFRLL